MVDIFEDLNAEQIEAIKETEGFIRVIAGPGSGKTRVLTNRYIYLVNTLGISPKNILCVTFTNKAANEMKKRIREIIPDGDLSLISTFHGFCVTILREDIHVANYPKNFCIIDQTDQKDILNSVYDDLNITLSDISYRKALDYIQVEKTKNSMKTVEDIILKDGETLNDEYENEKQLLNKIYLGYIIEQRKCYGLDFNDLLNFVLYIFEKNKNILDKWQKRLQYIMVDEFQDVNERQYVFCSILSGYHKNLFIVGDPDQTIYSFRGADPNILLNFHQKEKDAKTIFLNTNYRSTPNIIDLANSLISVNENRFKRELNAVKKSGKSVVYNHLENDEKQMKWIIEEIRNLLKEGLSYNDIAILYRSHNVARNVEKYLIENKFPYTILSGISFYERKEIKDVIAYIRMVCFKDDISFLRTINVPFRNIGKKKDFFFKRICKKAQMFFIQSIVRQQRLYDVLGH